MTFIPATCPATIFVTLPCPALSGQGRAGQVFYALQGSTVEALENPITMEVLCTLIGKYLKHSTH
jgi:hypothetical protein